MKRIFGDELPPSALISYINRSRFEFLSLKVQEGEKGGQGKEGKAGWAPCLQRQVRGATVPVFLGFPLAWPSQIGPALIVRSLESLLLFWESQTPQNPELSLVLFKPERTTPTSWYRITARPPEPNAGQLLRRARSLINL